MLPSLPENTKVISLEDVSVCYRAPQEKIRKFKEYAIRRLQGKLKHKSFLALKDINLSIRRGEVFGLIGHNGAGKTTLLKLVARVMRPTSGRVWVNGRVAPLLELGAGFHPELTGRENIFLNGAILGFSRREMAEKLPHIIDFAELRDFIDAPMRSYSSGMWARLGFAVATDTQPDILIIDEVLAVGDEAFQRKSIERIFQYRDRGATVLLVSHSMSMVESLCHRVAWLDHGRILVVGTAAEVVGQYRERGARLAVEVESPINHRDRRWGNRKIEITAVHMLNDEHHEQITFHTGQSWNVEIEYYAHQPVPSPVFGIGIHRHDGLHITGPNTAQAGLSLPVLQGAGVIRFQVPQLSLLEGLYEVSVAALNHEDTEMFDYHDRLYPFHVVNLGQTPGLESLSGARERFGLVTLFGQWKYPGND
jgi:lipopolysaccharide transport system ATP-binding protein